MPDKARYNKPGVSVETVECLEVRASNSDRLGWIVRDDDGGWWALAWADGLVAMEYDEDAADCVKFIAGEDDRDAR